LEVGEEMAGGKHDQYLCGVRHRYREREKKKRPRGWGPQLLVGTLVLGWKKSGGVGISIELKKRPTF